MTLDTHVDLFEDDMDAVAERPHDRGVAAGMGKMWANAEIAN
jgi:hypothetical protein